jgi:hypothetical protein
MFLVLFFALSFPISGFVEDFNTLTKWEPLEFQGVSSLTEYSVRDGVLVCKSNKSSAGLKLKQPFDPNKTPILRWRWKVTSLPENADITNKKTEDLPIRLYIIFDYDASVASRFDSILASIFLKLYDEIPPRDSMAYIWANRDHELPFLRSKYTQKLAFIPVDFGAQKIGEWQTHSRNIIEDYQMTYARQISSSATLVILCDSDNTGSSASAEIDFISLSEK